MHRTLICPFVPSFTNDTVCPNFQTVSTCSTCCSSQNSSFRFRVTSAPHFSYNGTTFVHRTHYSHLRQVTALHSQTLKKRPRVSHSFAVHLMCQPSPSEALRLAAQNLSRDSPLESARLCEKSVQLDPSNGRAWQDWANMSRRLPDGHQASEDILRKGLSQNPANPYLWQSLAILFKRNHRFEEAREHCKTGIACDPNHTALYATWAGIEVCLGNNADARSLFQKTESIGHPGAKIYHAWGRMELKQGHETTAMSLFQKGLAVDPMNPYIWNSMGRLARSKTDLHRARYCFQNALKGDATNPIVLQSWARLEAADGNYKLARELYQKGTAGEALDSHIFHSWSLFEFKVRKRTATLVPRVYIAYYMGHLFLTFSYFFVLEER